MHINNMLGKRFRKVVIGIAAGIIMTGSVWLLHNRTDNLFEEIYFSEYPSIVRSGVVNESLKNIKGWSGVEKSLEKDLGGNLKIYGFPIKVTEKVWVEIEKEGRVLFGSTIEENQNALCFFYEYKLEEKTLYVKAYFYQKDAEELRSGMTEELEEFLAGQGMDAVTIEELRDNILKEIVEKWLEGNKRSKFSMEDWGELEIVYE